MRAYLTGVAADGGVNRDPDASLGNFRGNVEVSRLGFRVVNPVDQIRIEHVAGANGEGTGVLNVSATGSLTWRAPGGTEGTAVAIADGETKVLEDGTDAEKYVRVSRSGTADLTGAASLVLTEEFNNIFDNVSSAEASAGDTEYRCVCLKNDGSGSVTNLKCWLGLTGTEATVDATGYSTGAVSIGCKESAGYGDWPESGYLENEDTGEAMYYSSRSATSLTVPAAGRDLWGETGGGAGVGAAGDEDDVLRPIAGMRIAKEAPTSQPSGSFTDKTAAGEGSQPAGLTWEHPHKVDDADVIDIGTLTTGQIQGLWLERIAPAAMVAIAELPFIVQYSFTYGGTSYTAELKGLYRVANAALTRYELFHGEDASPDFDSAAAETFSSLPHTTTLELAVSTVHYLVLRYRNEYGLLSQNLEETVFDIDASGDEQEPVPSAPRDITADAAADREVRVRAYYFYTEDDADQQADEFALWWTTDGSEPTGAGAADATASMTLSDGIAKLDYTTDEDFLHGTTVKVLVRSRRNDGADDYDSTNTTSVSATASAAGPAQVDPALAAFAKVADQFTFQAWNKWLDEGSGNFVNVAPDGSVEFYLSDVLVAKVDLGGEWTLYDLALNNVDTSFGVSNPGVDIDLNAGVWRIFEPTSGNQVLAISSTDFTVDNSLAVEMAETGVYTTAGSTAAVTDDGTDVYISVNSVRVAEVTATAFRSAGAWVYTA